MKRKAALFVATIALLFLGCVPIEPPVVEPPEPPILTMIQKQKHWQCDRKPYGCPITKAPHNNDGKIVVGQ